MVTEETSKIYLSKEDASAWVSRLSLLNSCVTQDISKWVLKTLYSEDQGKSAWAELCINMGILLLVPIIW